MEDWRNPVTLLASMIARKRFACLLNRTTARMTKLESVKGKDRRRP